MFSPSQPNRSFSGLDVLLNHWASAQLAVLKEPDNRRGAGNVWAGCGKLKVLEFKIV